MERAHHDSPITRVKCVVDNCEYWDSGNQCTASAIEVQPPHASDSDDTDCATFKPKDGAYVDGDQAIRGISGRPHDWNANMGSVDPKKMQ